MSGRMIDFGVDGSSVSGYLATPASGAGPGVVVLHAWWGLTEPFRQVCDRLAEAGFTALAPDLYHGKTTATVEEADELAGALDNGRASGEVAAAARYLLQSAGSNPAGGRGKVALIGFSLGGAFALDGSVTLADDVAAVVIFYATYTGLEFSRAQAGYLFHLAEHDPYEPEESVAAMKQELEAAGARATFYTYPGTTHWFFEANRPDAYDASAAALAWERTIAFLNAELGRA